MQAWVSVWSMASVLLITQSCRCKSATKSTSQHLGAKATQSLSPNILNLLDTRWPGICWISFAHDLAKSWGQAHSPSLPAPTQTALLKSHDLHIPCGARNKISSQFRTFQWKGMPGFEAPGMLRADSCSLTLQNQDLNAVAGCSPTWNETRSGKTARRRAAAN